MDDGGQFPINRRVCRNLLLRISLGHVLGDHLWHFFYHLAMRLLVGHIINGVMKNRANYTKRRYQLCGFETKLYKKLKVKQWKGNFPTYDPTLFDPKLHSWDEIAQAMCQAEVVHEVIVLLSFLPLLAAIPFGSFPVFFITSLLSAMYDLCFVVMQRYNRPRVLKCLRLSQKTISDRRKTDDQMES